MESCGENSFFDGVVPFESYDVGSIFHNHQELHHDNALGNHGVNLGLCVSQDKILKVVYHCTLFSGHPELVRLGFLEYLYPPGYLTPIPRTHNFSGQTRAQRVK